MLAGRIWKWLNHSIKSIILLFLVLFCFFMLLSSYGRIQNQTSFCLLKECATHKSNEATGYVPQKHTRLKTRQHTLRTDKLVHTQAEIQRQRQQDIEDACKTYYSYTPKQKVLEKPPYEIIVDDHHQIAYCAIPKIASTSWKRVWAVLTGLANSTDKFSQQVINSAVSKTQMRHLSMYPPKLVAHILANYTKFMFARHPLSRVLSAFRNKLAPDSTFILRDKWQTYLGSYIISKYRLDDLRYRDVNYTLEHYDLTFTEFVQYLTNMTEARAFNHHWMEMYAQCLPCEIQYDFIGKYETLSADAKYILKMLNLENIVEFPSLQGSSPTNSSTTDTLLSYYSEVPWEYVEKLLVRYNLDIRLFGYGPYPTPKHDFLQWLKRTAEIHLDL
ncbi:carbohydrate sulfotransferase 14-like [Amphiura filiformis]|uniref:carbohydrate sulfotransferase 14-like n=1 Tax=Amphiura filiformis TaxID=82378 RepID=UPI003B21CD80